MLKNTKTRRTQKREEANLRQAVYDGLTLEQKMARTKPGAKQHKKLTKLLNGKK